MSRLTVRLPETLHQQLIHLAEGEGVSLNQYIVYALTRQVSLAYSVQAIPEVEVEQQQQEFKALIQKLGQASSQEISSILAEREQVAPEEELSSDSVALLQKRIRNQR
jgi:acetylornithine deacetylase/succinyl-diaminopimelate desuccinylase-like protein